MFKKIMNVLLATVGLCVVLCGCDKSKEDGWKPLFGENLSDADYNPAVWSISESGVLSSNKDEIIFTKQDFQNFELDLEFKLFEGSNSGIVVYCSNAKHWIPNSFEIQIADNKKFSQPRTTCGSIYGLVNAEFDTTLPIGEWQKMRVRCVGKNIDVWLNGKLSAKMDMSKWTDQFKNPDGSVIPPWIAKNKKCEAPTVGKIGLQGKHGNALINFRNIRVRETK